VVPGLNDAHVHFPTWALVQDELSLEGCASLDEALARVRQAPRSSVIRGFGWRSAGGAEQPTKERLDEVTGNAAAQLLAKDYHSLWLNSAAIALAGGDLDFGSGVVERDERGEPTGVLREQAAWNYRERFPIASEEDYVAAMRRGLRLAARRGVTGVHDKDGWLGALGLWRRLEEIGALTLRVWQSVPADRTEAPRPRGLGS